MRRCAALDPLLDRLPGVQPFPHADQLLAVGSGQFFQLGLVIASSVRQRGQCFVLRGAAGQGVGELGCVQPVQHGAAMSVSTGSATTVNLPQPP